MVIAVELEKDRFPIYEQNYDLGPQLPRLTVTIYDPNSDHAGRMTNVSRINEIRPEPVIRTPDANSKYLIQANLELSEVLDGIQDRMQVAIVRKSERVFRVYEDRVGLALDPKNVPGDEDSRDLFFVAVWQVGLKDRETAATITTIGELQDRQEAGPPILREAFYTSTKRVLNYRGQAVEAGDLVTCRIEAIVGRVEIVTSLTQIEDLGTILNLDSVTMPAMYVGMESKRGHIETIRLLRRKILFSNRAMDVVIDRYPHLPLYYF